MRTLLLYICALLISTTAWAQVPQRMNYQAILRDGNGLVLPNTAGTLGIAVLQGSSSGPVVYSEDHAVTSNGYGLTNVAIGAGTVVSGNFTAIDWSTGSYYVRTSWDGDVLGTSQLLSVPYALFAEESNTPGPQGATGPQGPAGVAGAPGAPGATGSAGATGPQGPQGPQGANGATGPQGPAGTDGADGADGTGVTILGSLTNVNQLPGTGDPGDAYLVNGNLYVWSDNTNTWENVGSIQGPVGPQGPAGPQGTTGTQGAAGAAGAPGATGPAGPQGTTGAAGPTGADGRTVLSGNGAPSNATGVNGDFYINTTTNLIYGPKSGGNWGGGTSLVGPTGATGATGPAGAQGPQGNTGSQGPAGATGSPGAAGAQGPQGNAGPTGPQGLVGPIGATGPTGTNGTNGLDGKTVLNGATNPINTIGTNGDFYINTATNFLFGPKAGGAWPSGVALVGPQGPPGAGNGWTIVGNSGTVAATNFLGTTDAQSLAFRVDNIPAGLLAADSTAGTTALGKMALRANTTGQLNSAFGFQALRSNLDGDWNTALGYQSLYRNTTASSNTAVGAGSLYNNTTGGSNAALGYRSSYANTTGQHNVSVGSASAYFNTTGSDNVSVGYNAARETTTGNSNVAVGSSALRNNQTRTDNTAVGDSALHSNDDGLPPLSGELDPPTGFYNTATGSKSLRANTSGYMNTANGYRSLTVNTTGYINTAVGASALSLNTTGDENTAVGIEALQSNTTGNSNTAVGSGAGPNAGTRSNTTALGAGSICTASNQVRVGNDLVTSIGGYAGWTTLPSDGRFKLAVQEDVHGLDFLMRLRPVTYNVDVAAIETALHSDRSAVSRTLSPEALAAQAEKASIRYTGFIAQEVDAAAKATGYDFSGVDKATDGSAMLGLRYAEFVVPLVKAMQEQQVIIERLEKRIAELEAR